MKKRFSPSPRPLWMTKTYRKPSEPESSPAQIRPLWRALTRGRPTKGLHSRALPGKKKAASLSLYVVFWGIVQRQDCGLWIRQWRFESSSPSHFFPAVKYSLYLSTDQSCVGWALPTTCSALPSRCKQKLLFADFCDIVLCTKCWLSIHEIAQTIPNHCISIPNPKMSL